MLELTTRGMSSPGSGVYGFVGGGYVITSITAPPAGRRAEVSGGAGAGRWPIPKGEKKYIFPEPEEYFYTGITYFILGVKTEVFLLSNKTDLAKEKEELVRIIKTAPESAKRTILAAEKHLAKDQLIKKKDMSEKDIILMLDEDLWLSEE